MGTPLQTPDTSFGLLRERRQSGSVLVLASVIGVTPEARPSGALRTALNQSETAPERLRVCSCFRATNLVIAPIESRLAGIVSVSSTWIPKVSSR